LLGAAKSDYSIDDGGLFAVDPTTLHWTRVSHAGSDLGDPRVTGIVFDDDAGRIYVCTDGGLTVVSLPEGSILERITVDDGLPSNRVTDVARVGQKLYVACAPHRAFCLEGGLVVLDTKTRLVQRFSLAEGWPSYHLKQLRAEAGKVHVLYDSSRLAKRARDALPRELPFLAGRITVDVTHQGKRYLGGPHGLLIIDDPEMNLAAALPAVTVKYVLTRSQRWQAEAKSLTPRIATPDDLARFLRQENPLVRAKAMEFLPLERRDRYVSVLQTAAQDTQVAVRRKAAEFLKTVGTAEAATVLKPLLEDADLVVRSNAAVGLARAGVLPDLRYFAEILQTMPAPLPPEEVYDVLARQDSPQAFALLLEHGWPFDREGAEPPEFLKILGDRVRKHPELADMLLKAYDPTPSEESPEGWPARQAYQPTAFAAQVLQAAGKAILPVLYKALESPDRVVRSNAARASGLIDDPAAVPHLIKALDLESGLARASLVEALGRLKARDALPALIKLYVDAVNDEWAWGSDGRLESGPGFRSSQLGGSQAALYEYLSDLDALKGAWEDLKSTERPPPRDPRRHERLLTAEHLLKAIRDIGPENSPEFYRTLASDKNKELRQEAAIQLASARPNDLDRNLAILRNLAADPDPKVQVAATVTLHLLKQPGAERAIEAWLSSSAESEYKRLVLAALDRVEDGKRLAFARDRLRGIAADTALHDWFRNQAESLLRRIEQENK
jgi:HEAT repeat protein